MEKLTPQLTVEKLLQSVGITINGDAPGDIQVHNEKFYSRILRQGSIGLGESYMDKWWDSQHLDIFFTKILRAHLQTKIRLPLRFKIKLLLAHIINKQTKARAKHVSRVHYDLGNALFTAMLDKRMIYSCGYWKNAHHLDEAQEAKLELICQKLLLKPGMRLLDIGCGFGGLAKYAAEKYHVQVVGITLSEQQYLYAKNNCQGRPIEIRLQDYRDINETYDRIVSVGMFEHVGPHNYRLFMQKVHQALPDQGLFLLHTIGGNQSSSSADEWISRYIFPNGVIPSIDQIAQATEKLFVLEDWHNFGADYDKTLIAWYENFNHHWQQLKEKYNERFYRMWTFYLLSCAGSFRARTNQLWQVVLSKNGVRGGYQAPR